MSRRFLIVAVCCFFSVLAQVHAESSVSSLKDLVSALGKDYDEHIYINPARIEQGAADIINTYPVALDSHDESWVAVRAIYVEALLMQGKFQAVYEHYLAHQDKVSALPPSSSLPYLLNAHAYVCLHLALCDPLPMLERAKIVSEQFDNIDARLTVYSQLIEYYIEKSDYVNSLLLSELGLAQARQHKLVDHQGAFHATLGNIYLHLGQQARAVEHLQNSVALFQKLGMLEHVAAGTEALFLAHYPNDMQRAKQHLLRLQAMGNEYHRESSMPFYKALIVKYIDKDNDAAKTLLESIRDDYQTVFLYNRAVNYVVELGSVYLALGQAQEAGVLLNEFETYRQTLKFLPDSDYEHVLLHFKGRVSEELGDVSGALALYREYADLVEKDYKRRLAQQVSYYQLLIDTQAVEKERDKLSMENTNTALALAASEQERGRQRYAVIILLFAVLIVLLFVYRQTRLKNNLSKMAKIDVVTRVYTRMYLVNVIRRQPRITQQATACCLIDLDDFKSLNDKYGHLYGDHVLREVGRCLHKAFCNTNSLFGRWGGEEFLLISWSTEVQLQEQLAVFKQLLSEILINGETVAESITATVGMSLHGSEKPTSINDSIEYADQLMYQGKFTGKDKLVSGCVL